MLIHPRSLICIFFAISGLSFEKARELTADGDTVINFFFTPAKFRALAENVSSRLLVKTGERIQSSRREVGERKLERFDR